MYRNFHFIYAGLLVGMIIRCAMVTREDNPPLHPSQEGILVDVLI